jgi:hypothetical protein
MLVFIRDRIRHTIPVSGYCRMRTANIFIPVSGLACSYGKIFILPTYDLGKYKRDLGKRASSLSHMNTMQNFIGK